MKNIFFLLMIFPAFVIDILPVQASGSIPLCVTDSCSTKVTLGPDQMKSYYKNGKKWYTYETDHEIIIMRVTLEQKYGRYYRLNLGIINKSEEAFDLVPEDIEGISINKADESEKLVTYSAEMYKKKMKRQHGWAMALTAFSNGINDGMSSTNASYGYNQNNYAYQTSVSSQTKALREMQMSAYDKEFNEELQERHGSYLKRTTLFPGEHTSGYVLIKYKKSKNLDVVIPIKHIKYHVSWNVENMKK